MVQFDLRDIDRVVRNLDAFADQVPYALSVALNASVDRAREEIVGDTWPTHVQVRNARFLRAALTMKGRRATKRRLVAELYDQLQHVDLSMQETGGVRGARSGERAIPASALKARRTSKGMPPGLKPRNLPDTFKTDGRRANSHLKPNSVYQRSGKYLKKGSINSRTGKVRKNKAGKIAAIDGRKVKLSYTLKPTVYLPARVPFHSDFERVVRREIGPQFKVAMAQAMRTAFRR